ncbi:MAG TPA: hypothetical protein VF163_03640 [Micromonosporaceae bacterium]
MPAWNSDQITTLAVGGLVLIGVVLCAVVGRALRVVDRLTTRIVADAWRRAGEQPTAAVARGRYPDPVDAHAASTPGYRRPPPDNRPTEVIPMTWGTTPSGARHSVAGGGRRG